VLLVSGVVVLPHAERLPLMAQRALSFLPGKFDQATRESAAGTVQWRLAMWKEVLPEVPKCLFRGKGWAFDARDFYSTVELAPSPDIHAGTILVGDYHSGPLSLLLPFGIYGAVAFVWFLVAGLRVLHRNWKFGNPALRSVNALLLAAFATRSFAFFFVFGSLYSDMAMFTGLLGFSVALNGWDASQSQAEQPAPGIALNTEYIRA
jgi:O-antigen ligase